MGNSRDNFGFKHKSGILMPISSLPSPYGIGNFGKGVTTVYNSMKAAGLKNVEMKLYEGARHELFNELCYDEVVEDTATFIKRVSGNNNIME